MRWERVFTCVSSLSTPHADAEANFYLSNGLKPKAAAQARPGRGQAGAATHGLA
jgi:hypothetical protein